MSYIFYYYYFIQFLRIIYIYYIAIYIDGVLRSYTEIITIDYLYRQWKSADTK